MSLPKLPGLSALRSGIAALDNWAQSINQTLETLTGRGGDRVVMISDLKPLQDVADKLNTSKREIKAGDITIDMGGGLTASISATDLAGKLLATQQMKDALSSTTSTTDTSTTQSGVSSQSIAKLQGQIDDLAKATSSAASIANTANTTANAAKQLAMDSSSGAARGSIVAMGSLSNFSTNAWRDDVAIWCIQQNLGVNTPGVTPSPTDTKNLVTGDMVTLVGADGTTYMTRQWIKGMGWMDVGQFLAGNVMFNGSIPVAKIKSSALQVLDAVLFSQSGTYYLNGATTVNYGGFSLNSLASATAAKRAPIGAYGLIGPGHVITALAWNSDLASWLILWNVTGIAPTYTPPVSTAFLVIGDTVTLRTDDYSFSVTKTWNGSAWA